MHFFGHVPFQKKAGKCIFRSRTFLKKNLKMHFLVTYLLKKKLKNAFFFSHVHFWYVPKYVFFYPEIETPKFHPLLFLSWFDSGPTVHGTSEGHYSQITRPDQTKDCCIKTTSHRLRRSERHRQRTTTAAQHVLQVPILP